MFAEAPIVTFDGTDFLRINLKPAIETHTNDISVRFKTHKPNGLIFVTSNRKNDGRVEVDLQGGRARVQSNLGGEDKVNELKCCLTDFSIHFWSSPGFLGAQVLRNFRFLKTLRNQHYL